MLLTVDDARRPDTGAPPGLEGSMVPVRPVGTFVKFQSHVAVVIAPDGGCHTVAGVAGSVRVVEPVIAVAAFRSSITGKPHSWSE
jgi:hypothetical protein